MLKFRSKQNDGFSVSPVRVARVLEPPSSPLRTLSQLPKRHFIVFHRWLRSDHTSAGSLIIVRTFVCRKVGAPVTITDRAFTASLHCKTKYLLYLKNESPRDDTEFVLWLANVQGHYESAAADRICATVPTGRVFRGTPPYPELRTGSKPYGLVLGYEATTAELQSRLHALMLIKGKGPGRQEYAPVRFVFLRL